MLLLNISYNCLTVKIVERLRDTLSQWRENDEAGETRPTREILILRIRGISIFYGNSKGGSPHPLSRSLVLLAGSSAFERLSIKTGRTDRLSTTAACAGR